MSTYNVKPTQRLVQIDATNNASVVQLLPFAQTPNQTFEIQKTDSSAHTVTVVTAYDGITNFDTGPGGVTEWVLTDNKSAYFVELKIPGNGTSPCLVKSGVGVTTGFKLTASFTGGVAQVGTYYQGNFIIAGGVPFASPAAPYTIGTLPGNLPSSGSLPSGVSLIPSTGQVSGFPTSGGATFTAVYPVTDSVGNTVNVTVRITVTGAVGPTSAGFINTVTIAAGNRYIDLTNQITHQQFTVTIDWAGITGANVATLWLYQRYYDNGSVGWFWFGPNLMQINGSSVSTYTIDVEISVGASYNLQVAALPGTYLGNAGVDLGPTASVDLPTGAVLSNTIATVLQAPSASAAVITLTNAAGAAPTQANIYMGYNLLGDPWAMVNITLQTPGNLDPDCWFYDAWVQWTDNLGNPLNPGGISNTPGWQQGDQFVNNGTLEIWYSTQNGMGLWINYPASGVDGYLTLVFLAKNRNSIAGSNPATSDPNAVPITWPSALGGLTYYRLHVGASPGGATLQVAQAAASQLDESLAVTAGQLGGTYKPNDNALVNPSFEVGTLKGWTGSGGTVAAINTPGGGIYPGPFGVGSYYCEIEAVNGCALEQALPCQQGYTVNLSIWLNASSAAAGNLTLILSFYDTAGSLLSYFSPPALSAAPNYDGGVGGWVQYTVSAIAPPQVITPGSATASVVIALQVSSAGSSSDYWFVDNCQATITAPVGTGLAVKASIPGPSGGVPAVATNGGTTVANDNVGTSVIQDGGFELEPPGPFYLNPSAQWLSSYLLGSAAPFIDNNPGAGYGGSNQFAVLTGPSATIYQIVTAQAGLSYYLSAAVKGNGNTQPIYVAFGYLDHTKTVIGSFTLSTVVSASSWTEVPLGSSTAPSGTAYIEIEFYLNGAEGATTGWFVDNVALQPVIQQTTSGTTASTVPATLPSGLGPYSSSDASGNASAVGPQYNKITASDGSYAELYSLGGSSGNFVRCYDATTGAFIYMGVNNTGAPVFYLEDGSGNITRLYSTALLFGNGAKAGIYVGSGAPSFTANKGTLYLDYTNGVAYINTSGSSTWSALSTSGGYSQQAYATPWFLTPTTSRGNGALNTVYQNTTGNDVLVTVTLSTSSTGTAFAYTNSSSTPASGGSSTAVSNADLGASWASQQMTFVVLTGNYCEVTSSGSVFVNSWVEWRH